MCIVRRLPCADHLVIRGISDLLSGKDKLSDDYRQPMANPLNVSLSTDIVVYSYRQAPYTYRRGRDLAGYQP
jgi:hypothetical protein